MGLERRIEVIAMNFGMLPNFVVGTRRLATVQRRLAQYYIKTMPLKILEAPLDLPVLDESVHWNAAFDQDPACRWLRQILREVSVAIAPPAAEKRWLKPLAKKRAAERRACAMNRPAAD